MKASAGHQLWLLATTAAAAPLVTYFFIDPCDPKPAAAFALLVAAAAAIAIPLWVTRAAGRQQRQHHIKERALSGMTQQRDQLRAILLALDDAVLVFDDRDNITLANDAATALLGAGQPLRGGPLPQHEDAAAILTMLTNARQGRRVSAPLTLRGPADRHLQATAAPLPDDHVVLTMHDVTELRHLETMRRDFVENVSHELRTPVSVVRINAETLLDGALESEPHARLFVERIHRSAERLSQLVTDLLDLSRIEGGRQPTSMSRVRVRHAVDVVMADVAVQAAARQLTVTVEVNDDLRVRADMTGLEQILQNLLENAVRYTPAGGHISVAANMLDDHARVRIEICDDGPGIAARHRERIFERFYRVDAGRSRQLGGSGLGLAIVRQLATLMGGSVGVEAAASGGSCFWVTLDAAADDESPAKGDAA